MDTLTAFAPRRQEALSSVPGESVSDAPKTLAITVTYLLSEEGRKASLLAGGDGLGGAIRRRLMALKMRVPS